MTISTRALVLGGGGLTGIAWETGIMLGLERRGIRLRDADLIVGTSAGSAVAAQVTGPTPLEELYAAQIEGRVDELPGRLGVSGLFRLIWALRGTKDEQRALAKVGGYALRTKTVPEPVRRAVIEQRLPVHTWPDRALKIPAIDAVTGELVVFDRTSGVELTDAVAASCAIPMVWPPVTIGARRCIDGGIRSVANVDLAAGYDRVVVITPGTQGLRRGTPAAHQLAQIQADRSALVSPDDPARTAMGRNALDPNARAAAARAGLEQADRVADLIRGAWD
ncbi:patatin-like phospholipase family protein [Microbacterium deminutum]|uniref:Patatin-like phospholipase family protein n=1 Tax=Microbacterium deminutum TaxID=344164 RepID=A0ABN2QIE4_9MICO